MRLWHTLHWYIGKKILGFGVGALLVLFVVQAIFHLVSGFKWQSFVNAVPSTVQEIIAPAALIGVALGLGSIQNELVAVRASGVSKLKIALVSAIASLPWCALALFLAYKMPAKNSPETAVFVAHDDTSTLIIAQIDQITSQALLGVNLWYFDKGDTDITPSAKVYFSSLNFESAYHGTYTLSIIKHKPVLMPRLPTPSQIRLRNINPSKLSFADLRQFAWVMDTRSAVFWGKIAEAILPLALAVLATSIVFLANRGRGVGGLVLISLLIGVLFHYLQELVLSVAQVLALPFIVALPCVLALGGGAYLLKR